MQILNEKIKRTSLKLLREIPDEVIIQPHNPAILKSQQQTVSGACLKCNSPLCMYFNANDIKCEQLIDFPEDRDVKVCPVGAITWDEHIEMPIINDDKCIRCGLCVSQCPVGAIYLNNEKMKICCDSNGYDEVAFSTEAIMQQNLLVNKIRQKNRYGCFIAESDQLMLETYYRMQNSRLLPEKFIRNVIIGLGCKCATRRIGDVYVRMDAIYSTASNTFGVIEVEFGTDTLSASRGILDDIAVLHSRYQINKESNIPLVVSFSLPNLRQGYWQVVKDIAEVENIKINTLSCGAMLLLLWNQKRLNLKHDDFYADYDSPSIRKQIESKLDRKVKISTKFLGILEPFK